MLPPDVELGREFLADHPPPGRVLLCAVTGSHTYGFPSTDSDLDLKGIHLAPTRALLGLRPHVSAHDRLAVHRGTECDLTTNAAGAALSLLLQGNGNMLERILSPYQLVMSEEVRALQGRGRARRRQAEGRRARAAAGAARRASSVAVAGARG